jgi:hypothetical protein
MNGLMNGKPYHGTRRSTSPYVSQRSFIDYESMAQIVKEGIKKGLVIPPSPVTDAKDINNQLIRAKRTYGTGKCVLCSKEYTRYSNISLVCTPCKSAKASCPICSKAFVPYRKSTKNVSSCSSICGVERMKQTKRGKSKK